MQAYIETLKRLIAAGEAHQESHYGQGYHEGLKCALWFAEIQVAIDAMNAVYGKAPSNV